MNKAQSPRTITDPETVRQWRAYEAASRRAKSLYAAMPIALYHGSVSTQCACGRRTTSRFGTCRTCLLAGAS